MIVFLESLRLAFSSLRANPLRAFLTILGIVIGVAAVVALTSIGGGSTRSVENQFSSFGTDTITVQTSRFSSNATPITQSDLKAIQKTAGVKTTVYTVDTNAAVTYGSTTAQASVTGTLPGVQGHQPPDHQGGNVLHAVRRGPRLAGGGARVDDRRRSGPVPAARHRPDHQRRRRALPDRRRAGLARRAELRLGGLGDRRAALLHRGPAGGVPPRHRRGPCPGAAVLRGHLRDGR